MKPYQFGKGSPKEIKSGAFWFYYRLGFRPVNSAIKKSADAEWKRTVKDPHYRTNTCLLKSFTACNKEWKPVKAGVDFFDTDKVSMAVTQMIRRRFAGNRDDANNSSMLLLSSFFGYKK